eukprot:TRINITY_DN4119_c0_g1_i1.p1 TRINITY_DN4119_c0_g1~~TRINITY_DN4119_c0_g1_i1.p1  ORF type:complete len:162 (+),score=17.68 TRINITY_DN4119_c0_g1_i1:131-616(+)
MAKRLISLQFLKQSNCNNFPRPAHFLRYFSEAPHEQTSDPIKTSDDAKTTENDSPTFSSCPRRERLTSGSLTPEQIKMKREFYHSVFLRLLSKAKNIKHPMMIKPPKQPEVPQIRLRRRMKKVQLPTHYIEVNYKTLKAVVYADPDMDHLPPKIKSAVEQL